MIRHDFDSGVLQSFIIIVSLRRHMNRSAWSDTGANGGGKISMGLGEAGESRRCICGGGK